MLGLQRENVPGQLMVELFSKTSSLCDHNSPTSQTERRRTDRQTDKQTTCDCKTALCTLVHCAVIKLLNTVIPTTKDRVLYDLLRKHCLVYYFNEAPCVLTDDVDECES